MPKRYGERIEKLKEQREGSNGGSTRSNKKPRIRNGERDTRQKIIVGGAVIAEMQIDVEFAKVIQHLLSRRVGATDRDGIGDFPKPDLKSTPLSDGLSDGG